MLSSLLLNRPTHPVVSSSVQTVHYFLLLIHMESCHVLSDFFWDPMPMAGNSPVLIRHEVPYGTDLSGGNTGSNAWCIIFTPVTPTLL